MTNRYRCVSEVYDVVYRDRKDDARFYLEFIGECAAQLSVRTVLELGAGTGRVVLPMAHRYPDITFTALDQDAVGLELLRRKLEATNLTNVDTVLLDLADLSYCNGFDAVVAPFRVLQHLLSIESLRRAFVAVLHALRPGGFFAFDLFNPSIPMLAKTGARSSQQFVDADGSVIHRRVVIRGYSYFDQVQQVEEIYRIQEPHTEPYRLSWRYRSRFFFKAEVELLLTGLGFAGVEVFSDFAGGLFGSVGYPGDLVVVARKPAGQRDAPP